MDDLLFLSHRIPYPPDKGDKIRSFHWLKGLSDRFRIHLGTFIDDPEDEQYVKAVGAYCASLHVARIGRSQAIRRSLSAVLRGEPISLAVYRDTRLSQWVYETCRSHAVQTALVFSSGLAPYLLSPAFQHVRKVLDFVDVDSDKWRQYAARSSNVKRWVYEREARSLSDAEGRFARGFEVNVLVSEAEAQLFRERVATEARVEPIENGVDCDFFNPYLSYVNPYPQSRVLVFTGAMDYGANVDAVTWFTQEVFSRVRAQVSNAMFYIVGNRPTPAVRRLARQPGIVVTGRVPDVRPYLAHAAASVAPLRIARGVQNKVLEALAMDLPVLATPQAVEGVRDNAGVLEFVSEDPEAMARYAVACLTERNETGRGVRRRFVEVNYSWHTSIAHMTALLNGVCPPKRVAESKRTSRKGRDFATQL